MPALTYWERVAQTRWGAYTTAVERRVILKGQGLCGTAGRMLEVGCEGGRWSKMLAELKWQVTCTDIDAKVLAACQQRIPSARCLLREGQDTTIPLENGSFEFLLCMEVAPVIQSHWFLPEAYRLLAENGILVGMFWNLLSWRGIAYRSKHALTHNPAGHYYKHAYPKWRRELARSFKILYQEGLCWGPFGRASNSSMIPLFTLFERILGLRRMTTISPWVVFIAQKRGLAQERGQVCD